MRLFFACLDERRKLLGNFEILKIFDENSIEKLNSFIFWKICLLKIEPWEITPFFFNNLFRFRGNFPPCHPLATHLKDNFHIV